MKKMKSLTVVLTASLLALSMAACGGAPSGSKPETAAASETAAETETAAAAETEAAPETEAAAEEDGQNPVMNFIGFYTCDMANVFIEATDGKDGAHAQVTWESGGQENDVWDMTGTFDPDSLTIAYNDCVKTHYVYQEDGEVESMEDEYTGGTGVITFSDGDGISLTWQDDQENIADGMVFNYDVVVPGEEIANPWHDAESLSAAAEGAGLDDFMIAEEMTIGLGDLPAGIYRYMDGIAEADYEFPAVSMTVRKGKASAAAEEGDISGDYNEYANTWTQNIKGLEVTCFGNREGDATKTIWTVDDTCYSITAYGLGGDTDYGLSPDDLNSLINGIQ